MNPKASEETYKELFRKYYSNLLFYASRMLGEDEAEDVVQDVFVDLWKRKEDIYMGEQILSFLYRSVYTKALNILNHRNVVDNYGVQQNEINQRKLEFYQPDNSDVINRIENQELRNEIMEAVELLPEKCKEVFKMSYLYEMKNKEIADVLGVSPRTVESHMYKALRLLRESLNHLLLLACFLTTLSKCFCVFSCFI